MAEEDHKIVMAGFMKKKGSKANTWGDRYFVLKGFTLLYFLKQNDFEPKGSLVLNNMCRVSEIKSSIVKRQKLFLFRIIFPIIREQNEGLIRTKLM